MFRTDEWRWEDREDLAGMDEADPEATALGDWLDRGGRNAGPAP